MKDSIKTSIIAIVIFLLMFGFCFGYLFRFVQVKAELKEQEKEYLKLQAKAYYVKGGRKMLELRNSKYNTHKIEENFYKSFENEFNK